MPATSAGFTPGALDGESPRIELQSLCPRENAVKSAQEECNWRGARHRASDLPMHMGDCVNVCSKVRQLEE